MGKTMLSKYDPTLIRIGKIGDGIIELVGQYIEMIENHTLGIKNTFKNEYATLYVIQQTKAHVVADAFNNNADLANPHIALLLRQYIDSKKAQNQNIQRYVSTTTCYDIFMCGFYVDVEVKDVMRHQLGYYMDDSIINLMQDKLYDEMQELYKSVEESATHYDSNESADDLMTFNVHPHGFWKEITDSKMMDAETFNNLLRYTIDGQRSADLYVVERDNRVVGKITVAWGEG